MGLKTDVSDKYSVRIIFGRCGEVQTSQSCRVVIMLVAPSRSSFKGLHQLASVILEVSSVRLCSVHIPVNLLVISMLSDVPVGRSYWALDVVLFVRVDKAAFSDGVIM